MVAEPADRPAPGQRARRRPISQYAADPVVLRALATCQILLLPRTWPADRARRSRQVSVMTVRCTTATVARTSLFGFRFVATALPYGGPWRRARRARRSGRRAWVRSGCLLVPGRAGLAGGEHQHVVHGDHDRG